MTNPTPDQRCHTCGQTFEWHGDHKPHHPFNMGQDGALNFLKRRDQRTTQNPERGSQVPQMGPVPTDPILRIALINRGVISPADLVIAEEQLRQALSEVEKGDSDGQPSEGAWGRQV